MVSCGPVLAHAHQTSALHKTQRTSHIRTWTMYDTRIADRRPFGGRETRHGIEPP